jgi:D-sedoheptulose 7-phosphate isomerase
MTIFTQRANQALEAFQLLGTDPTVADAVEATIAKVVASFKAGGKLLILGNGGSAADAQHFAGELVGRFYFDRAPLPAISLSADTSVITCVGNDYSFDEIFSRQVSALATDRDVVFGISTSGNSENVHRAFIVAREAGAVTVLLTGARKGRIEAISDVVIAVPSSDTPRIQEMHLFVEHFICENVEAQMFKAKAG